MHGGDYLRNHWQTKKVGCCKGLEVPCVHTSLGKPRNCLSYYLWRRLQTARTSCLPFNRLCSKPQSQDFSKCHTTGRCPFPRNRISCFQSHNNHKRVLKCHLRWRSCRVPRIVFYWLLRSQDFLKCHADFSKCHTLLKMSHSGRWCYFLDWQKYQEINFYC